jgi:hypothetical protein
VDEEKSKQVGKMQVIAFRSGNAILFSTSSPKQMVTTLQNAGKVDLNELQRLYGENAIRSDYALIQRILETTPSKIGVLTPERDAVGSSVVLMIKGIMVPGAAESGIFQVRSAHFQGFQYGDPRSRPKLLDVELFADEGGVRFVFSQKVTGTPPPITQSEINRVIQTVRRVPVKNQD